MIADVDERKKDEKQRSPSAPSPPPPPPPPPSAFRLLPRPFLLRWTHTLGCACTSPARGKLQSTRPSRRCSRSHARAAPSWVAK